MGLFDERIAYKPFEYPEYYTEGWLKQAQAFWLHTEISMSGDIKAGILVAHRNIYEWRH